MFGFLFFVFLKSGLFTQES